MGEIFIIGGGIIGLSAAVRLVREGADVTLIDRPAAPPSGASPLIYNSPQPASWGNAGHIAVEQTAPLASADTIRSAPKRLFSMGGALCLPAGAIGHWLPFSARLVRAATATRFEAGQKTLKALLATALPEWQALAAALGAPDLVRDQGHIVLWESQKTAAAGNAAWGATDIGTARLNALSADDLSEIQSLVKSGVTLADGVRFGHTGQVTDLQRLRAELLATFEKLGGTLLLGTARLEMHERRARIHLADNTTATPETVIVASGVGSRPLMESIGHKVPMIAERGYHIRASAESWPADLLPVVFEDRSMIVTRYADCVQAASFVEFSTPDAPPDPAKWERLEQHIAELGLPFGTRLQRWIGVRPTLPDYLPAIGRSSIAENLVYAFGHQHLGLTLAPVTAGIVCDMVAGRAAGIDLGPIAIERFGFGKGKS